MIHPADTEPKWSNGAYYLAYQGFDGAWHVVYYYHNTHETNGLTISVWRVPS